MAGIDCPEMKPPRSQPDRDEEIKAAKAAKSRLEDLIVGRLVQATFGKFDKYGRPLVTLFLRDGRSINQMLVEEGHAVYYDGGTKNRTGIQDLVGRATHEIGRPCGQAALS